MPQRMLIAVTAIALLASARSAWADAQFLIRPENITQQSNAVRGKSPDIDGWGNYKFGMSIEDVRHIISMNSDPNMFSEETNDVVGLLDDYTEAFQTEVSISGLNFRVRFGFKNVKYNQKVSGGQLALILMDIDAKKDGKPDFNQPANYFVPAPCPGQDVYRNLLQKYGNPATKNITKDSSGQDSKITWLSGNNQIVLSVLSETRNGCDLRVEYIDNAIRKPTLPAMNAPRSSF